MNPEQWLSLKWNGGSTMSDRWLNQSKIIHECGRRRFKERISVTEHRGQAFERRKSEREGVGDTGSLVWSYI